jgi:hypothetical protein
MEFGWLLLAAVAFPFVAAGSATKWACKGVKRSAKKLKTRLRRSRRTGVTTRDPLPTMSLTVGLHDNGNRRARPATMPPSSTREHQVSTDARPSSAAPGFARQNDNTWEWEAGASNIVNDSDSSSVGSAEDHATDFWDEVALAAWANEPAPAEEAVEEGSEKCGVCLDSLARPGLSVADTACGHTFCAGCISAWLERSKSCPLCRARCSNRNGPWTVVRTVGLHSNAEEADMDAARVRIKRSIDQRQPALPTSSRPTSCLG